MQVSCIIDGNYILSKLVFTLHKNNALYGSLLISLQNAVSNYKKIYPFKSVYLVSDSKEKSWRKDLSEDYKASRKRDSDIDWKFVYSTYDEFKSTIKGMGVLEHPRIEGDDWISYVVSKKNSEGTSTMIISNDHDIKQIVTYDLNDMWMNFMSNDMKNQERVFMPKNYNIFLDRVKKLPLGDIFEPNDNFEFLNLMGKFNDKYQITEVDSTESLIIKLISGDTSDNISSVYQVIKNGRKRGIGEKGAMSIYEMYVQEFGSISILDPDLFDNIADLICEKKKLSKTTISSITSNLYKNMKMIDLRLTNLPKEVITSMENRYNSHDRG